MDIEKTVQLLTFVIMGSITGMMLAVSYAEVVYSQNATANETSTGPVKFGSFMIGSGQNVTGNERGAGVTQPGINNGSNSSLSDLTIDHAGGDFTSMQTDTDNTTWIATGKWDLESEPSAGNQSNTGVVNFNATVGMRDINNSNGHEHEISEFRLTNSSITSGKGGSVIMFNGTGTVETDVGLYSDVPISIKIIDVGPVIVSIDTQTSKMKPQWIPRGGTIGVSIDERVQDHFGDTPVYGDIRRER
jgi:hypothetical protein